MNKKPILLGRLSFTGKKCYTITGYLGDTESITEKEYEILKLMDGYNTINDIAKKANVKKKEVEHLFDKYESGEKKVTQLQDWNKTSWCNKCRVYYIGEKCSVCNTKGKKMIFSPPCDPWIALNVEKEYVSSNLKKKFGITISDDSVLLTKESFFGKLLMEMNLF